MDLQKQISKELKRDIKKYKKALDAAKKLESRIIYLKNRRTIILNSIEGGS